MDRSSASLKTFEKCPECEYRLPNHSYNCSIRKALNRRDFLKKAGAIAGLAGFAGLSAGIPIGHALPAPGTNSTIEPGSMNEPASYVIYIDGSTILARNGKTGVNDYSGTDASTVINNALSAIAATGGKIFIKAGTYNLNSALLVQGSNIWIEGEGGSADNDATFANASFQGTILLATNSFPAGASAASPNYIIVVGGNGLVQLQGGGIKRLTLGSARGYSTGNIAGIAMGFALKYVIEECSFGAFRQSDTTDFYLNGPGLTFNANLSNPTQGSPTGGWFWIQKCVFQKNGGEECIKFADPSISDTFFDGCVFFGPFFNQGCIYVTNGTAIRFTSCMFYEAGNNTTPSMQITGTCTGLQVSGCTFEQQAHNASGGNTTGFVQLNITADQFLDGMVGVVFMNNTYYVNSTITTPLAYVYKIVATTANCPIHINGDIVVNRSATAITFLNNASTSAQISVQPPPIAVNTTLPAISGTLTAGGSPFTYTNNSGYPQWINIVATNGMTALTWRGVTISTTAGFNYLLNPGDTMVFTWTTTAPTYKTIPASLQV